MGGMSFAAASGLFAAVASVWGKVSVTSADARHVCEVSVSSWTSLDLYEAHALCEQVLTFVQIGCFFVMILCNAVMWTLFTKALRLCSSTLEATVVNTAANFFISAIFGSTFFGEQLSFVWYVGTLFIIFGLILMHHAKSDKVQSLPRKGLSAGELPDWLLQRKLSSSVIRTKKMS